MTTACVHTVHYHTTLLFEVTRPQTEADTSATCLYVAWLVIFIGHPGAVPKVQRMRANETFRSLTVALHPRIVIVLPRAVTTVRTVSLSCQTVPLDADSQALLMEGETKAFSVESKLRKLESPWSIMQSVGSFTTTQPCCSTPG